MEYRIRFDPLLVDPLSISIALVGHKSLVTISAEVRLTVQAWPASSSDFDDKATETKSPHTVPSKPNTIPGQWADSIVLS
jgi:hypothetical protein